VVGEGGEGEEPREGGVEVEEAAAAAGAELGPEREEEAAGGVEGDPADDVAEDGAEGEGEEGARDDVDAVPEGNPRGAGHVVAQLDRAGAADQEPEDEHDGR